MGARIQDKRAEGKMHRIKSESNQIWMVFESDPAKQISIKNLEKSAENTVKNCYVKDFYGIIKAGRKRIESRGNRALKGGLNRQAIKPADGGSAKLSYTRHS